MHLKISSASCETVAIFLGGDEFIHLGLGRRVTKQLWVNIGPGKGLMHLHGRMLTYHKDYGIHLRPLI